MSMNAVLASANRVKETIGTIEARLVIERESEPGLFTTEFYYDIGKRISELKSHVEILVEDFNETVEKDDQIPLF